MLLNLVHAGARLHRPGASDASHGAGAGDGEISLRTMPRNFPAVPA